MGALLPETGTKEQNINKIIDTSIDALSSFNTYAHAHLQGHILHLRHCPQRKNNKQHNESVIGV